MSRMLSLPRTLALASLALTIAAGSVSQTAAQETGRIRVVHMSPDAPPVDVLVDGQVAIAGLAFRNASPYAPVPAGVGNVRVTPAGQNQTAVLETGLPVPPGQDQTVVAVGRLAAIGAIALQDDNRAPSPGKAKVRFVHASPDAPAVDIAVAGGPVLFANIAFRDSTGYAEVDAGAYTVQVRPAGTGDVVLSVPNVNLQPGQIVTIFAAGLVGDNTLRAVPVLYPAGGGQAAGPPRTGTGGPGRADSTINWPLLVGLALIAVVGSAGARRLVAVRRQRR